MGGLRRLAGLAAFAVGVALFSMPGSAIATTGQITTPFIQEVVDPCTLDTVTVTGELHMVYITSNVDVELQTNWPDTTGVGATGRLYQANDAQHLYILSVPAGTYTLGFHDDLELVSTDGMSNLLMHEQIAVTVDLNFVPIRIRMQGDATCSGPTPP